MAKILVVDDDGALRRMVRLVLMEAGHDVELAATADDAWFQLEESWPDLIVLDINMPGMPVREFVKKARDALFLNPILVLSGNVAAVEISSLIGADDALEKPLEPDTLIDHVTTLLSVPQI